MYNNQEACPSSMEHVSAYITQHDLHHPEMTVRETLDFAGRMFGTNDEFCEYISRILN